MVLLAKYETGGAAGLVWEKAGDEGAIEVTPWFAHELLSIPGDLFYVVEKEIKKVEKEVEKVTKKATPVVAEMEIIATEDIAEAIATASPTKRRSTKE